MESPSLSVFHSSLHNKFTVIFFHCHTKLADQRQQDDYLKIKYECFKHNSCLDHAFKSDWLLSVNTSCLQYSAHKKRDIHILTLNQDLF